MGEFDEGITVDCKCTIGLWATGIRQGRIEVSSMKQEIKERKP
jgi:hypothetical protein